VLEGSVRQDGERLRISVRLIEASRDRLLWSKVFDRELSDIFTIQDNIARAVGSALQLQLDVGPTPHTPPTRSGAVPPLPARARDVGIRSGDHINRRRAASRVGRRTPQLRACSGAGHRALAARAALPRARLDRLRRRPNAPPRRRCA
jgi:hypothetical protein